MFISKRSTRGLVPPAITANDKDHIQNSILFCYNIQNAAEWFQNCNAIDFSILFNEFIPSWDQKQKVVFQSVDLF